MNWFNDPFEIILLTISALLLIGVFASKASHQLGVPALLIFLVIGMLAGSDGLGGIEFYDPSRAQALGIVALSYILFSGGLDTHWQSVRPVLWRGIGLATIGVALTAALMGLATMYFLGLTLQQGLLLGAIISSTDAAAVFGVLRSKALHLSGHLRHLIELESGSNDPMAVFLTLSLISLLMSPDMGPLPLLGFFGLQLFVGLAFGLAAGKLLVLIINRLNLEYDGLYPVLTISMVLLTYSATAMLEGSGFLAVYVAGLVMGNANFVHKASLTRFHDGLAWLMQIAMFLTLGLLVFPSELVPVAISGLILSALLILVARPIAVFITLALAKMNLREKTFVSWVGLKGAVPIILATFPLLEGVPESTLIFNVVFFVVLTSVLAQGTTISLVARWLRLEENPEEPPAPNPTGIRVILDSRASVSSEFELRSGSPAIGKQLVNVGLPQKALVLALRRDDRSFIPTGSTVLRQGDRLLLLIDRGCVSEVETILFGKDGPSAH